MSLHAVRSLLFTPGHKADWIVKAAGSASDAVIIDLEDAVPADQKEQARYNAREALATLGGETIPFVRVNALDTEHAARDITAVVTPELAGLVLPKVYSRDDMIRFDALVTFAEVENGLPRGSTALIPSLETAQSVRDVEHILGAPRVAGVMAAAAKDADISRELGFAWTAEGKETLYLRSRVVVAARSAGLQMISLGLWQDVADLEGLDTWASENARLGFTAAVIIHPTHALPVNRAFGLGDAEAARLTRLIHAFEQGVSEGRGAVRFEGEHIDKAHADAARQKLTRGTRG